MLILWFLCNRETASVMFIVVCEKRKEERKKIKIFWQWIIFTFFVIPFKNFIYALIKPSIGLHTTKPMSSSTFTSQTMLSII